MLSSRDQSALRPASRFQSDTVPSLSVLESVIATIRKRQIFNIGHTTYKTAKVGVQAHEGAYSVDPASEPAKCKLHASQMQGNLPRDQEQSLKGQDIE